MGGEGDRGYVSPGLDLNSEYSSAQGKAGGLTEKKQKDPCSSMRHLQAFEAPCALTCTDVQDNLRDRWRVFLVGQKTQCVLCRYCKQSWEEVMPA